MLVDRFGRKIEYLRISVTDKCNYRCVYCMPEEGIELKSRDQILSFESIAEIARAAASLGIWKIRLTGGEPLVRRDIEKLVEMISDIPGIGEVAMTTNGSLLSREKARALKRAGLSRVNISLDTLDSKDFEKITRGGDVSDVLEGIEAAAEAGLVPIKINKIISDSTTSEELERVRDFCRGKGLILQTIKQFSLYDREEIDDRHFTFDRPMPCSTCNKIRLTADGYLLPCLFSNRQIRVDFDDIEGSIRKAVEAKPRKGTACHNRMMGEIGG